MIPKIIHYCWFGGSEKPPIVKQCINSWKIHLADYKIIEWNEENFNMSSNLYVLEAYKLKKFAFVSDFVRVHVLYNHGGIYLDTDVEVFRTFDDLLHHHSFWGFEQGNYIATSTIGAVEKSQLIKRFLNSYKNRSFLKENGNFDNFTNVALVTNLLEDMGLKRSGEYQEIENIGVFYPQTYFSPYDYINCRNFRTDKTYTMHYYHKSWLPFFTRIKGNLKVIIAKVIGGENIARVRSLKYRLRRSI